MHAFYNGWKHRGYIGIQYNEKQTHQSIKYSLANPFQTQTKTQPQHIPDVVELHARQPVQVPGHGVTVVRQGVHVALEPRHHHQGARACVNVMRKEQKGRQWYISLVCRVSGTELVQIQTNCWYQHLRPLYVIHNHE